MYLYTYSSISSALLKSSFGTVISMPFIVAFSVSGHLLAYPNAASGFNSLPKVMALKCFFTRAISFSSLRSLRHIAVPTMKFSSSIASVTTSLRLGTSYCIPSTVSSSSTSTIAPGAADQLSNTISP